MSGASYRRGSAVISRQTCADTRCPGCVRCREHVPTPRPEDWGEQAAARALDVARRVVSGARRYGLADPTVAVLAQAVRERARVGEATAQKAAETALSEQ